MKLHLLTTAASAMFALVASQAAAEDWYLRAGLGHLSFDTGGDVNIGGAPVPGAGFDVSDNNTLLVTLGYHLTPRFSVELTGGIPPTTTATGNGTAAALGDVGELTYGAAAVTGNYHFLTGTKFKPYVGGGIAYFMVLDTEDGAVTSLEVENAFAPVIQAGFDYAIDDKWGTYFNVAKVFAETEITGNVPAFGGAPLSSDADIDITIISAGIAMRF